MARTRLRFPAALALALATLAPGPALAQDGAQEIAWRSSSVQGPRLPGLNIRLGVAIFAPADPATVERRVRPAGQPVDGKLPVDVEMVFRFADGATISTRSRETVTLNAQGVHGLDEWTGEGEFAAGTGRFAGITGRFSFRAVMGLDGRADGLLGDSFLEGRGRYTLAAPPPAPAPAPPR